MGAFYGSIQIQSEDQAAIISAVEPIMRRRKIKCLVGPALGGWVGVYPEMNGQDDAVGADIAKVVQGFAIHMLVHDDDVMAYWLWRDGELADSYFSRPGYFGEAQRAEQEARTGKPDEFSELIGTKTSKLVQILDRTSSLGPMESERLEQFAKILGITNALTAYEYLKEDDAGGIKNRRRFHEVPGDDVAAEKLARQTANREARALRQRAESQWKKLAAARILLLQERRDFQNPGACAIAGGFAISWGPLPDNRTRVEFYEPPWRGPQETQIEFPDYLAGISSDATGKNLLVGMAQSIAIYQRHSSTWIVGTSFTAADRIWASAISKDGKHVAYATRDRVYIAQATSPATVVTIDVVDGFGLVFHPDGRSLLIIPRDGIPLHVQIGPEPIVKRIYVGGRIVAPSHRSIKDLDIGAIIAAQNEGQERAIEQLTRMFAKAKPGSPEAKFDPANARQEMQRDAQREISRLQALKDRGAPPDQPGEQVTSGLFVGNGEKICLMTNKGLNVFRWKEMLEHPDGTATPIARVPTSGPYLISAVAEEPSGGAVFLNKLGHLCRLDLTTGQIEDFFEYPSQRGIISACFSGDGQTLAIGCSGTGGSARQPAMQGRLDIWSYEELRERARFIMPV